MLGLVSKRLDTGYPVRTYIQVLKEINLELNRD